jgi:fructokinase
MYDVVAIGELLVDFTPLQDGNTPRYEQNAGGAPANVLVSATEMGRRTCFIGKVGDDPFGHFLNRQLSDRGVDTRGLKFTDRFKTTLAFVHLDESGERTFSFYRTPGADMMLSEDDLDISIIRDTRLFHFGSVSMTHDPARTTTLRAVQIAKNNHAIVTFDPNIRLSLWDSTETARTEILSVMDYVDVLKVSDEELTFLTGSVDVELGAEVLMENHGLSMVLVTLGSHGCLFRSMSYQGIVPGVSVHAIDTTAAGDAFMGAFIGGLLDTGKLPSELTYTEIESLIRIANASGALATTKRGGIPSLPTKQEILQLISTS